MLCAEGSALDNGVGINVFPGSWRGRRVLGLFRSFKLLVKPSSNIRKNPKNLPCVLRAHRSVAVHKLRGHELILFTLRGVVHFTEGVLSPSAAL